ncbi:hypothetical protein E1301_Tti020759 [Triplophysa tibetana]|uniref:Uncharacterized protein n=1 Tax=Triplophysa tibetana TaxID=1572043 RepID=A0A5A9NCL2_9TELE|nr:hypothetical protein E1301_Tti020759 [Triplophysa tibetana]
MRSVIAWILMCQVVEVRVAVIGDEIVKVKEGDTVDKIVDISGLKLVPKTRLQKKLEPHHFSSVQSSDCEDEASDDSITTGDKNTERNLGETSSQPSQHHNLLRPSQPSRHIGIPVTNAFSHFHKM